MRTPNSPRIRVEVTEEIIKNGIKRDSKHCMFAEAIKKAYPGARKIAVDLATVRLTDPKKRLRFTYLTPRIMQVQLVRYDQGRELAPFDVLLRGAHITRSGTNTERRGKQKKPMTAAQRRALRKATAMNS